MRNIVKSLSHDVRRDFVVYISVLLAIVLPVAALAIDEVFSDTGINAGNLFQMGGQVQAVLFLFLDIVVVCRIAGRDFNDKTISYERLSGHSHLEVYAARCVVALGTVVCCYGICFGLPLGVYTIMYGWGENVSFWGVVFRLLVTLVPIMRHASFLCCLTFLMRNQYLAMLTGYLLGFFPSMVFMVLEELLEWNTTFYMAYIHVLEWMTIENGRIGYVNGEDLMVYATAIPTKELIIGILVAGTAVIGYLVLGYVIFRKRDFK